VSEGKNIFLEQDISTMKDFLRFKIIDLVSLETISVAKKYAFMSYRCKFDNFSKLDSITKTISLILTWSEITTQKDFAI